MKATNRHYERIPTASVQNEKKAPELSKKPVPSFEKE
jgi:hypothetical protein